MTDRRAGSVEERGGGWVSRLRRGAPALFLTLVFWLGAESVAVLLLPVVVPRHVALSWYLGAEARQTTARFLSDRDPFMAYDARLGWSNRPGCGRGNWRIDSLGSRSTHALSWERRGRPRRLLFLGNSMTNGGSDVTGTETISAFCEDSLTEAGNFATMLYFLDQMVLAYTGGLHRFSADVVVAGLPARPYDGLTSRYVPFHQRDQVLMPYFKPRLVPEGDTLRLDPVPSREQWRSMLTSSPAVDSAVRDDGCLGEFTSYRRFGLTPLSAGLREAVARTRRLSRLLAGEAEAMPLVIRLMHALVDEGARHRARVVFLVMPRSLDTFPSRWRRALPDHYAGMVADLRREGFAILDGREVLRGSGLSPQQLYMQDAIHYRPVANRLLAERLRDLIGPPEASVRAGASR
jgi:hypothetical protein